MGFFSKVFKGIKKVVKKIGKGIKSAFKKVGKFMGKIGIVGQIALGLLLPGIGTMLGSLAGSMMGTTIGGITGAMIKGAGYVLNTAVKIGSGIGSTFKTLTSGITKVVGQTAGTILSKIPGGEKWIAKLSEKGLYQSGKGILDVVGEGITKTGEAAGSLFSKATVDGTLNAQAVAANAARDAVTQLPDIKTELASTIDDKMSNVLDGPNIADPYQSIEIPQIDPFDGNALAGSDMSGVDLSGINYDPSGIQISDMNVSTTGQRSLLDAVKEVPGKLYDKAITAVDELPGTLAEKVVETPAKILEQKMYEASGVKTVPEYNVQNVSNVAYVPNFINSGQVDIGTSGLAYQPINVMQDNLQQLGGSPFGYAANLYNDISYAQRMSQYGYA